MKNETRAMLVVTAYILIMLVICVVAMTNINKDQSSISENSLKDTQEESRESVKEIVYVPIYTENDTQDMEDVASDYRYNIKAYQGKIGVFSESGALLKIIDVNIKSLPKTDRDLLEKGFSVNGEAALLSIIEDYTG